MRNKNAIKLLIITRQFRRRNTVLPRGLSRLLPPLPRVPCHQALSGYHLILARFIRRADFLLPSFSGFHPTNSVPIVHPVYPAFRGLPVSPYAFSRTDVFRTAHQLRT